MRVSTSRYQNKALANLAAVKVDISIGRPRFRLGYEVEYAPALAPRRFMLRLEREEYERHYRAHLDQMGVEVVLHFLQGISQRHGGQDLVLLCFNDLAEPGGWCHRRMLADWLREKAGLVVEELGSEAPLQESLF